MKLTDLDASHIGTIVSIESPSYRAAGRLLSFELAANGQTGSVVIQLDGGQTLACSGDLEPYEVRTVE